MRVDLRRAHDRDNFRTRVKLVITMAQAASLLLCVLFQLLKKVRIMTFQLGLRLTVWSVYLSACTPRFDYH